MKKKSNNTSKKYAVTKPYYGIPTPTEAAIRTEAKRILLKFNKEAEEFHKLLMEGCRIENTYTTFINDLKNTDDTYLDKKIELLKMIQLGRGNLGQSKDIIIQASELIEKAKKFDRPEDALSACFTLSSIHTQLNEIMQTEISGNYAEVLVKLSEYFTLVKSTVSVGDKPNE